MPAAMHSTRPTSTSVTKDYLPALARLLLCSLFIWDGVLQLRDPAGVSGHLGFGIFRRDLLVLNFCSQRNCWTDSSSESAACGFAAISFAGFIGTFPYFGVVVTNFSRCIAALLRLFRGNPES